jgi:dienelactone hydrolase
MVYTQKQPAPTILISHGSGCAFLHVAQWAKRIEAWGYNAVVIDHCVKRDVKPHSAQQLPKNLQVEDRIKDYVAVADWVRKQAFHQGKLGLIGLSRGGEGVLGMLNEAYYGGKAGLPMSFSKTIDAAVAYYPGCHLGDRELRETSVPLLVNIGELDALTPPINCAFYNEGSAGKIANLIVETYPSSHHSFDFDFKDRWASTPRGQVLLVSYNAKQAAKSFDNTKAFFDKNLK